MVSCNYIELRDQVVQNIQNRLSDIAHFSLIKAGLWVLGEFSSPENVEGSLNSIKKAIGSLPLEEEKQQPNQTTTEEEAKKNENPVKKIKVKTIILPDGTYGTEVINESDVNTSKYLI